MKRAPELDPLRERLCARELAEARAVLASGDAPGLVARAEAELGAISAQRAALDALARAIDGKSEGDRRALVAEHLRATVTDRTALKGDLRALRRGEPDVLDLAALAERSARATEARERLAEVCLALARAVLDSKRARALDLGPLATLATTPGRWTRRAEALALLVDVARRDADPLRRPAIAACARPLTDRGEHRWVQPLAVATLAAVDDDDAHAIARERLRHPASGDDLLVRARLVQVAARRRKQGWWDLFAIAAGDPSDLVRMTVAGMERSPEALVRFVTSDPSPKVRVTALVSLAHREGKSATKWLVHALENDTHDLVAQAAAVELVALARKGPLESSGAAMAALERAAAREDRAPSVRAAAAEALFELDVLLTPFGKAAVDVLRRVAEETPDGGASEVESRGLAALPDEVIARALAVVARTDSALGVDRRPEGLVFYRGDVRTLSAWRVLYEALHPLPSKRQAFVHTWARSPRGALRAPPGGMAELTATQVPGERVLVERVGGWGRHLPLVDDLLHASGVRARSGVLATPLGLVRIEPASSLARRLAGWVKLTARYARFADLRRRALASDEREAQASFLREVARATGIRVELVPWRLSHPVTLPVPGELADVVRRARPDGADEHESATLLLGPASALVDRLAELPDAFRDLVTYATSPAGNRLPHLAGYAIALLGLMLVRGVVIRHGIDGDRREIPLVIGGWGTRGKSGTERLKAGLFQGLGHETLVKTTGCEAMFIHALPGVQAREVFIYRPYDKATVWEQRDVLRLARRFGAKVFLWECMALQPDLVNLLQHQWMKDDFSTITNAYPDHEDVQGPAGVDVAAVISEFVPTRGKLFTSEDQMLPILRERARERGTLLRSVSARQADLIADDLLARFPYQEHPRNIALVVEMARALGVPSLIAMAEMADNVVPDLGVLKTYPTLAWRGRTMTFTNGMSANERTGALANWRRTGFHEHDPDSEPATWIATVVNNRADRVARSEVFARFLVEDIGAHRHVLIGTNVSGLLGFIRTALDRHLAASAPTRELAGDPREQLAAARTRIVRAFARLKVGKLDAESVVAECAALRWDDAPDAGAIARAIVPSRAGEPHAEALLAVSGALGGALDDARRPFLVAMVARRRTVRAVLGALDESLATQPAAVDRAFADAYRAIFDASVVALDDPSLTGDQVLDRIAREVPPGAHARVMGVQNIKGTGLDFVYRWVSADMVSRALAGLDATSQGERARALRALLAHDDYGLLDAKLALERVEAAVAHDADGGALPYAAVLARLRQIVAARTEKLTAAKKASVRDRLRRLVGETLDFVDSVRRRRMAADVMEALVAGRLSHGAAAIRMRDILARTKGAWMRER